MARVRKSLPSRIDVAHLIGAGVLASVCPRPLIEEILESTGRSSLRNRSLPAPLVVYYVMALGLWREAPLEEVLRVVSEGIRWLGGPGSPNVEAGKSAISQARSRLGAEVMRRLADRVLSPLAKPNTPGSWFRGLRVMALDGTSWDLAAEKANAEMFGFPNSARGECAFPQARLLGLVECGTHAIVAASIAPCRTSERAMADQLFAKTSDDMLILADRGFFGFRLWKRACASGSKLLWRVRSDLKLPVERRLEDGSFLSRFREGNANRTDEGTIVRVVEYELDGAIEPGATRYRLVTNILDSNAASALELANLYHERWEIENVFDELKTHMRGSSTVLRSKTPELVEQELWGLLLSHFAVRRLMVEAAWKEDVDVDRLSFTHAVRVVKRKMPQAAALPPWEANELESRDDR